MPGIAGGRSAMAIIWRPQQIEGQGEDVRSTQRLKNKVVGDFVQAMSKMDGRHTSVFDSKSKTSGYLVPCIKRYRPAEISSGATSGLLETGIRQYLLGGAWKLPKLHALFPASCQGRRDSW